MLPHFEQVRALYLLPEAIVLWCVVTVSSFALTRKLPILVVEGGQAVVKLPAAIGKHSDPGVVHAYAVGTYSRSKTSSSLVVLDSVGASIGPPESLWVQRSACEVG